MAIQTDSQYGAGRFSVRPLDSTNMGHYRAVSFSGACASLTAAQILASARWTDSSRYMVLTRLAMNIEVLTAITAAPVFDAQAFVFRGSTGNSSGAGSSTLTLTGNNAKDRQTMNSSVMGEIRTIGTTTPLTGSAGKTNDSSPFGAAFWGVLFDTSATGTAVLVSPGAAVTPGGWQNLYSLDSAYQHPLILQANEGIEIQVITANNASGTVKYGFLWEWAEVQSF